MDSWASAAVQPDTAHLPGSCKLGPNHGRHRVRSSVAVTMSNSSPPGPPSRHYCITISSCKLPTTCLQARATTAGERMRTPSCATCCSPESSTSGCRRLAAQLRWGNGCCRNENQTIRPVDAKLCGLTKAPAMPCEHRRRYFLAPCWLLSACIVEPAR